MKAIEWSRASLPREKWLDLLAHAGLATVFSHPDFYLHHDVEKPVVFIGIENEETNMLVAGAVGVLQNGTFASPFAASYGGLFVRDGLSFKKHADAWTCFMAWMTMRGLTAARFTYPPSVYSSELPDTVFFLSRYNGFKEVRSLYSSVVLTANGSKFDPSLRTHIRQAERNNLKFSELDDLSDAYGLLVENKKKFNQLPVHSKTELERLRKLFPDKALFFGAFLPDATLVSATFVLVCKPGVWLFFYIMTSETGRSVRAVPWMLDQVFKKAKTQQVRLIDFGVSHETDTPNPMDPKFSLIQFKENFGAKGCMRQTLEWQSGAGF
jgi:hypothetical protein